MRKNKKNQKNTAPKNEVQFEDIYEMDDSKEALSYTEGKRTLTDTFAPSGIAVLDENTLRVGDKFVRNYVMQGYPNQVYIGWLNELFSAGGGDIDTIIYAQPADDRHASEELTRQITSLQADLQMQQERGHTAKVDKTLSDIAKLQAERRKIELNQESLFRIAIFSNIFRSNLSDLNRDCEAIENRLRGRRINFIPTALRMIDGYKSALPTMKMYYSDKLRNFNTGALVGCFPFYDSEICDPHGVYLGVNLHTNSPLMIDFYSSHYKNNTNISFFGKAGSGKSYAVSLLTMRSALKGIRTAIIDPEGEYVHLAKSMGGLNIDIKADSAFQINPFEIEAEDVLDDNGKPMKDDSGNPMKVVSLSQKAGDLLNLIAIMCRGDINQEQQSLVSEVILQLYHNFGINDTAESLLDYNQSTYDEKTGDYYTTTRKKRMPTFTDFHNLLVQTARSRGSATLEQLANKLVMFKRGGAYGMFDCESTINNAVFTQVPIINFNVSKLEESVLRPIGMYIAMDYIWQKFVLRDSDTRKRVICDEAWMLMNKSMAGHEYTAAFLEKCARRIRKRNAGLLVASQNFYEFASSDEGRAVLSNTAVRFFLQQSSTDVDALQQKFNLSDGEKEFLMQASLGDVLIRTETSSAVAHMVASPYEHTIITKQNVLPDEFAG